MGRNQASLKQSMRLADHIVHPITTLCLRVRGTKDIRTVFRMMLSMLLFFVCSLEIGSSRQSLTWRLNSSHALLQSPRVYVCGYNFTVLASVLFPERIIKDWNADHSSVPNDILIASGYHCNVSSGYSGKILYVDGENGVLPVQFENRTNVFYLGAAAPENHRGASLQLFHIAHTTLFHPYSESDFLRTRLSPIGSHFLVYINSHCVDFREHAFDAITNLARQHQFELPEARGTCKGYDGQNIWNPVGKYNARLSSVVEVMRQYRFALVMENSNKPGYVTEKIANAFIAGAIPVYYGTRDVFKIFNPDAFIYYDIEQPIHALQEIVSLEMDLNAYSAKRAKPILRDGTRTLAKYFSLRHGHSRNSLRSRIRRMLGADK